MNIGGRPRAPGGPIRYAETCENPNALAANRATASNCRKKCAPGVERKAAEVGPFTPSIGQVYRNCAVSGTTERKTGRVRTNTARKKRDNAISGQISLRRNAFFLAPRLLTGIRKRQYAVTDDGRLCQFGEGKRYEQTLTPFSFKVAFLSDIEDRPRSQMPKKRNADGIATLSRI